MTRLAIIIGFLLVLAGRAALGQVPGGRSPNGEFDVVDVDLDMVAGGDYPYRERHFEIHDKSGKTLISELSLEDLTFTSDDSPGTHVFGGAWKAVWRADSCFVAIETYTSKFATKPIVFFRDGDEFRRIKMPEYEPFDEEHATFGTSDNTHREPLRWRKNGDLVLDITMGYHTKSDGGITGYFAIVHFAGKPPKATKGPETKTTNRD